MDKSSHSSGDSSTTNATATSSSGSDNNNSRDQYLKQLNRLSHKISKPTIAVKKPGFDPNPNLYQQASSGQLPAQTNNQVNLYQQAPAAPPPSIQSNNQANLHQHQPPVYNINKSDFRDVVQRLTGSPAHERISAAPPPPVHQPKPQSSRLQRIRPPPLAHVSNRPPPLLTDAGIAPNILNPNPNPAIGGAAGYMPRPTAPLSPLPPFPPVHAAAESPISAYMRYLQSSIPNMDPNPKQFSGFPPLAPLVSPRWYQTNPPPQQENAPPPQPNIPGPPATTQQGIVLPASTSLQAGTSLLSQLPPSPPPFGCVNSPRSPYHKLSPSLLLSPTSGQLRLPLSPTVPVPSPQYKEGL